MTLDHRAEIEWRAYQLWKAEGQPQGKALDHWLRAEAEMGAQRSSEQPATVAVKFRVKRPARRRGTANP